MLHTYKRVYICTVCMDQFYEIVPYVCIITVHKYSHILSNNYIPLHSDQEYVPSHVVCIKCVQSSTPRVCVPAHVPLQHCWKARPSLLDSCLTWISSATTAPASPTSATPTPPWDRPRSTCQGGLCVPIIAGGMWVSLFLVCVCGGGGVSIRCIHIG